MTPKQHIVSFSGGKDSTAMLLMMLERDMQVDRVVCVDTTKEFPQMYEHIAKVQEMILPLKIEIVKLDFDYWFTSHQKTRGKYKHILGYGWPDMQRRWCTALKNMAFSHTATNMTYNPRSWANRRVKHGHIEYRGFAYDERESTQVSGAGRRAALPVNRLANNRGAGSTILL